VNDYVYLYQNSIVLFSLSFLIQHWKKPAIRGWTGKQVAWRWCRHPITIIFSTTLKSVY